MNIFKNLSKQDLKKVAKLETTKKEFKNKEGLFVSFAFLFWNDDGEKIEQIESIKKSVVFGDLNLIKEDKNNKAEMLKALSIAKLKDIKNPAVKIGYAYYNPEFIYFAFAALNPAKTCIYQQPTNQQNPMIYMTDGEIKFVCMPLRVNENSELDQHNIIKPEFITAEDIEKARKYKVYLEGKAGKYANSEYYLDDKNVILKRKEFFVVIPKYNEFFARVFDMPKDESEYNEITTSDTAGLFEVDPEQHKNTEDLFHKKIAYFKNITHGNFWHFYENGTGVCFNA